jgi:hypothetical protein
MHFEKGWIIQSKVESYNGSYDVPDGAETAHHNHAGTHRAK